MSALYTGDCRDVLANLDADSVDTIITDPPYELSDSSETSAARVAAKVLFPKHSDLETESPRKCHLGLLASKVARLCGVGLDPRPSASVPVTTVALDEDSPAVDHDVEDGDVPSVRGPSGDAGVDGEAQVSEHFGRFTLEVADVETAIHALGRLGTCLCPGGFRVGLRIAAPGFQGLRACGLVVDDGDPDVGLIDDALAIAVGASLRAEELAMPRLPLTGGSTVQLSASAAMVLFASLTCCGAKLVRARSRAGRLPAMPETNDVRVVAASAHGTLAFDLAIHPAKLNQRGFMGKEWDGSKVALDPATWRAVYRVLKPGGTMLVFGGTRTFHRVTTAIEDAGFEIRDCMMWLYAQGFPKSLNLEKAGAGGAWRGWGTALKPAWEPIVVAMKPLDGTFAANAQKHGVAGLNIDGGRIATDWSDRSEAWKRSGHSAKPDAAAPPGQGINCHAAGRWPANVVLDEVAGSLMDEQSGDRRSAGLYPTTYSNSEGYGGGIGKVQGQLYADSGGASRFLYCAKASKAERGEGNDHPTVKPLSLMRYLCRLTKTPTGGVVLDPFMGSGSTGVAALQEGRAFVGVDLEEKHVEIARRRMAKIDPLFARSA